MEVPPASAARTRWHVTIRHGAGSPEHFHHFLLGFFVPLVYHLSAVWKHASVDRLVIRSCGPLDRIIGELGDDRVQIIDKNRHREMAEGARDGRGTTPDPADADRLAFVTIDGCDYPPAYDAVQFAAARDVLFSLDATRAAMRSLAERWPGASGPRILLIQRGPSLAYYHSDQAEGKRSGQDRRSIPNHDELYRSLRREYPGCLSVMTETLPLAEQIAFFSLADVIIAQHGAALSNLIWARRDATVIEIFPDTGRVEQKANHMFGFLAFCMGVRYRKVRQRGEHSPVDVEAVRRVVAQAVAAPPRRLASALRSRAFRCVRPALPIVHRLRYEFFRARGGASRVRRRGLKKVDAAPR
jgi:hypothetical protein